MARTVNNRQRVVALLATLHGDDVATLTASALPGDAQAISDVVAGFSGLTSEARREQAAQILRSLQASERFSGLSEIHPGWILKALLAEPPRLIGIILRYLPSHHVRFVIEHLPADVREKLPHMVEAFSVSPPLLDVIRQRFERRFVAMPAPHVSEQLSFDELSSLKTEELEALVTDIGLEEFALALGRLSSRGLRMLLNRLPLKEAKRVKARMGQQITYSETLRRQAPFTVLAAVENEIGSQQLLFYIGLVALARALPDEDDDLLQRLQQKLSPEHASSLRRSRSEWADDPPQGIEERRQLIMRWGNRLHAEHDEVRQLA